MAHIVYDKLKTGLLDSSVDLVNDDIYVLLVQETNPTIITSAQTVADTMSPEYSGTSATPLTETSGINYTAAGKQLENVQLINSETIFSLSADNVSWDNSTITAGGILFYKLETGGTYLTSGIPLIYMDLFASRVSENDTFELGWGSEGIIEITS